MRTGFFFKILLTKKHKTMKGGRRSAEEIDEIIRQMLMTVEAFGTWDFNSLHFSQLKVLNFSKRTFQLIKMLWTLRSQLWSQNQRTDM